MKKFFNFLKSKYNKFIFQLLNEKKLPPAVFKVKIETKCLVLAPYIGAETRGLGGLIAQYPKNFEILALTNGSSMIKNVSQIEAINIKKEQFFNVMKHARVKGYKIFNINTGTLKDEYKKISRIDISEVDFIFVPNPFGGDLDTLALINHLKMIIKTKEHKKTLQILMYESDCALTYIDYYTDITNIASTKKQMLNMYYSNDQKLISGVIGLNKFRSINYSGDMSECFASFFVEDFLKLPLM